MLINLNKEHIDALVELESKCFTQDAWSRDMLEDCFKGQNYYCIGYGQTALQGYLIACFNPWEIELLSIGVLQEFRGQKIAYKLMQSLIDFAKQNNKEKIFLEVRKSNLPAINLYTKCNFKPIYERKNYYQGTEDAIIMELCVNEF